MADPDYNCVARIRTSGGMIVGTGFLVSDTQVVTCAHVVLEALGLPPATADKPSEKIILDFPFIDRVPVSATVEYWKPIDQDGGGDIAVLRLKKLPSANNKPAHLLTSSDFYGRSFATCGFPDGYDAGAHASGEIGGRRANGTIQIEAIRETGIRIYEGFSGAPVWDLQASGIVGMIVTADIDPTTKVGFIIPSEQIALVCLGLSVKNISIAESYEAAIPVAPNSAVSFNLVNPNPYFKGREEQKQKISTGFFSNNNLRSGVIQIISGLGGTGKTSLAIEFTHLNIAKYKWVFFCRANSKYNLENDYISISKRLGLMVPTGSQNEMYLAAVQNWMKTESAYLFILDNANEIDDFSPDYWRKFIPLGIRGHILITTRTPNLYPKFGIHGRQETPLGLLPESDAIEFLTERITSNNYKLSSSEEAQVPELAHDLDYLALALEQAGAALATREISLADYRDRLNLEIAHLKSIEYLRNYPSEFGELGKTVETTWQISFDLLKERSPAAAEILTIGSFLAPDAIPQEIILSAAKDPQHLFRNLTEYFSKQNSEADLLTAYDSLISYITKYSLVSKDPYEHTISIHRLVQWVNRVKLSEEERKEWITCITEICAHAFYYSPKDEHRRFISHILMLSDWYQRTNYSGGNGAYLLSEAGSYIARQGNFGEHERLLKQSIDMCHQYSEDGSQCPAQLNNLGELYRKMGRYKESRILFKESLFIRFLIRKEGKDNFNTVSTLNNVALLHATECRYMNNEKLFNKARAIFKYVIRMRRIYLDSGVEMDSGMTNQEALSQALSNLAGLYLDHCQLDEAERLFIEALSSPSDDTIDDKTGRSDRLNNIGRVYLEKNDFAKAKASFDDALSIRKSIFHENHPNIAISYYYIGLWYQKQSDVHNAMPLFQKALIIQSFNLLSDHPFTKLISESISDCEL